VAAALNLTVSGSHKLNLRFKIRALIRNTLNSITSSVNHSSASVADFFNSFESHRRPVLMSIAALHRIDVPTNTTIEVIRTKITEHIISGRCAQFANTELPTSRPKNLLLPDCTDVRHEWQFNGIDPDLQIPILSALYGSKLTIVPLRRLLSSINVTYNLNPSETCVKSSGHTSWTCEKENTLNEQNEQKMRPKLNLMRNFKNTLFVPMPVVVEKGETSAVVISQQNLS
jgi:hypothetical protein